MFTADSSSSVSTRFSWFKTVDEAIEVMLDSIQKAKASVRLEMYIFSASVIGERFREAMTQAALRGVRVSVLIDSWGSLPLTDRFWDGLKANGGKVRWFNPLSLGRGIIRDHRKLLVCDEEVAFVGGFNISPEYQGNGITKGWFDLGIQVVGSMAKELATAFDSMFLLADFKHRRFARFRKAAAQKVVSTPQGQILLTGPGHDRQFFKLILNRDLRVAKSIQIIAAYFLPLRPIRRALIAAARRGTRVQIVLGAKSDVPLLQLACRRFYQTFIRAGVEIYEYQPQILHAKLLLFDDVVYVGSANLDRRSFLANYELLLRITESQVASEGREIFNNTLVNCKRVELQAWRASRSIWSRLKERWAFFFLARLDPGLSRRQLRNLG